MRSRRVDLVIVGAGFAGLACARAAALAGLSTVVLERKEELGANPHTTGLLVKEVAEEWHVPPAITRKVPGVRLYAPSLRAIDLSSPDYYFLATETSSLLRWFGERARGAGAQVLTNTPFQGAHSVREGLAIEGTDLVCRFLVGADGATSRVARAFELDANKKFLVGTEVELENVGGVDDQQLHCFLDRRLARGYIGWVVPGVGITQVGLAHTNKTKGPPPLDAFLERVGKVFDLSSSRRVGARRGLIPVGGPLKRIARKRVLLVGDAAGLVSPLTAGGIHAALRWGASAGNAVAAHLISRAPHPHTVIASSAPKFRWKRLARSAFETFGGNLGLELAVRFPPARGLAQLVYFHHRGLLTREGWRALLRPARSKS